MNWNELPAPAAPDRTTTVGLDATLRAVRRALRRGEWPAAEALLMAAGPVAGNHAPFLNLVGVVWEVRGDRAAARKFYCKAIRADHKYEPAQQNMRRHYELRTFGRTVQAVALGDQA
jgi:hypothetical protein